ncbi:MAG: polysaccharide biosynthesis tyrosine autokinase [Candidatus Latescibacteria bacterium]|nr:polysaccharide biosynthesis tyrosine autokinase [Candidatus Latescibacterota bacterium]
MPQYDVNIRDYWRIVRKRKAIIIFAAVMLGLFVMIATLLSRPAPIYRAESKVRFQISQVMENPLGGRTVSYASGTDDLETQKEIITSYEVLERVAIRTGRLDTTAARPPSEREEQRINAILNIRGKVSAENEGTTSIVNIAVTDGRPQHARDLANAIAEVYRDYNLEMTNRQATRSREFILGQRNATRDSVFQIEQQIKDFRLRENIMSVESQTAVVLGRMSAAEDVLKQTQSAIQNIDRVLGGIQGDGASAERTLATLLPDEGGGAFSQLQGQLVDLNVRRNSLLVEFTEQHPQLKEIDARKQDVIRDMLQALRNRREALRRQEQTQQMGLDTETGAYQKLPELGLTLANLEQQLRLKSELLLFYERQAQEAEIRNKEEIQEVEIIQRALLPDAPINPSSPLTTSVVGTIMGLILGVVFAFIAETLDTSIGTIEDVEEYLHVSVVGIIPHIDIDEVKESLIRKGVPEQDTETLERRARLAAHFDPQSTLAESYRALRTNIQFVNVERGAKVISVTSASNQEGKSTTVSNLAMTMAQAGNRVLLVDCDLRKPTVYRMFGLDRESGLTDVILGNYAWRDVVRTVTDIMTGGLGMEDIMMTPGMDNLNIITSGAIPPNPAEITDSRRMNEFIAEAREAYDIVLFDSPPVLQATDATVLGTKVDGVLIVYKIGQVSRGALRRAKLQLDNLNIPVLGIVLNGLRAEVSEDFQDLRYYTYYSYGSERKELTRMEKFKKSLKPITDTLQKARALLRREGREEAPHLPAEIELEIEPTWWDLMAKILIYLLLGGFVVLGLLWQIGFFDAPHRPEPPIPRRQLQQEGRKDPSQTRARSTAYTVISSPEDQDAQDPTRSTQHLASAPLLHSPRGDAGAQGSAGPSDGPAEHRPASGARSVSLQTERRYAVQAGAFRDGRRADQFVRKLREKGYDARTLPPEGTALTRVVIAGFDSPQAAGGTAHRLRRSGLVPRAAVVDLSPESVDSTGAKWASVDNDTVVPAPAPR